MITYYEYLQYYEKKEYILKIFNKILEIKPKNWENRHGFFFIIIIYI
jgi:hypothetical protein